MLFQKTINVYAGDILERLIAGTLKLQPGQWIVCGSGLKSRWCGVTNTGSLVAVHDHGHGIQTSRFQLMMDYWRTRRQYVNPRLDGSHG